MSRRILIVDDDPAQRQFLRDLTERAGHQVVGEAASGQEALAQYHLLRPDVVLMDLVMPRQNGVEATRAILAVDPGAKIIALSGLAQPSVQGAAMSAGAVAFVPKPVDGGDLLNEILDASPD